MQLKVTVLRDAPVSMKNGSNDYVYFERGLCFSFTAHNFTEKPTALPAHHQEAHRKSKRHAAGEHSEAFSR